MYGCVRGSELVAARLCALLNLAFLQIAVTDKSREKEVGGGHNYSIVLTDIVCRDGPTDTVLPSCVDKKSRSLGVGLAFHFRFRNHTATVRCLVFF